MTTTAIRPTTTSHTTPPTGTELHGRWGAPTADQPATPHRAVQHQYIDSLEHTVIDRCCEHYFPSFDSMFEPTHHTLGEVAQSTGLSLPTVELLVSLGLVPVDRIDGVWMISSNALDDAGLRSRNRAWRDPQMAVLLQTAARMSMRSVARVHGSAGRWRHAQYLGV